MEDLTTKGLGIASTSYGLGIVGNDSAASIPVTNEEIQYTSSNVDSIISQYATRDFYKGQSFRYLNEWEVNHHYFNDAYYTDFVSYENALYACNITHLSDLTNKPGGSN